MNLSSYFIIWGDQYLGMDSESKYEAQVDKWEAFAQSLEPFTKLYRRSGLDQILKDILVELTKEQERLLIYGKTDESSDEPNPNIRKLTGIAYLSGGDTWIDLPRMLGMSILQADKVSISTMTPTSHTSSAVSLWYH